MSRRSLSVHHSSAGRKLPVITKTKINCNSDVGCASFLTKKKEISSCSFLILFNSSVTLCLLPGTLPLKVILCTPILLKKKNLKFSTICLLQSQKVNFLIPKLKLFFKLKKKSGQSLTTQHLYRITQFVVLFTPRGFSPPPRNPTRRVSFTLSVCVCF